MGGFDAIADFLASESVQQVGAYIITVVFLMAGQSKLRSPVAAAHTLVVFGFTSKTDRRLGFALGIGECSIGAGVSGALGDEPAVLASYCAVAACIAYLATVAIAVWKGTVESCACFSSHGSPLDGWTLVRNLALVVLSLLAVGLWTRNPTLEPGARAQALLIAVIISGLAVALRVMNTASTEWARISGTSRLSGV